MKFPIQTFISSITSLFLILILNGCGGGGSKQSKTNEQNNAPIALFSISTNPAVVGESVSFNSSGSSDVDNDSLTYSWQFGDGESSQEANPSHIYTSANSYTVSLIVTDSNGAASSAFSLALVVNAQVGNQAPTASFTATPNPVTQGVAVNFNSSGSSDPDTGDTLTYTWLFGDGAASSDQNPSHIYSDSGVYSASLVVTDNNGASSAAAEQTITVLDGASNNPPTASFTANPNPASVDANISFDGSNSMDPDGDSLSFAWDFGDGANSSLASPTHSYSSAGSYSVSLVVTDSMGATSNTASETIVVEAAVNQAPTASFTATPNPATVNSAVQFDSSSSSDPEGDSLTYSWDFGDGSSSVLTNPSHSYSAVGSYQVELVVTDSNGNASQPDITTLTVNEEGSYSGVPEPWPETKDLNLIWFGASTTAHGGSGSTPEYDIPRLVKQIYQLSLPSGETSSGALRVHTGGGRSLDSWLNDSAFNEVEAGPSGGGSWDYVIATAVKSAEGGPGPSLTDATVSVYDAFKRVKDSTKASVFVNYPVPRLNDFYQVDIDSEGILTRYECLHTLGRDAANDILNGPTGLAMDTVYSNLPNPELIARLKTYDNFPASFPDDFNEEPVIFIYDVNPGLDPEHYAQPGAYFVANIFATYLYGINPIGLPLTDFSGFCDTQPSSSLCSISDNMKLFLQAVAYDGVYRYRLGERPKRNNEPVDCDVSDQLMINGQREDAYLNSLFN